MNKENCNHIEGFLNFNCSPATAAAAAFWCWLIMIKIKEYIIKKITFNGNLIKIHDKKKQSKKKITK